MSGARVGRVRYKMSNVSIFLQSNDSEIWWRSESGPNTWRNLRIQNGTLMQNVLRICWSTDCQDGCWSKRTTPGFGENGGASQAPVVHLLLYVGIKLNLRGSMMRDQNDLHVCHQNQQLNQNHRQKTPQTPVSPELQAVIFYGLSFILFISFIKQFVF